MGELAAVYNFGTGEEVKQTRRSIKGEREKEPFKDLADIEKIIGYFRRNGEYRNMMMFVMGINLPLRGSDLRLLRWGDIFTITGDWNDEFYSVAKKTGKVQWLALNQNCKDVIEYYLRREHLTKEDLDMGGYLFTSRKKVYNEVTGKKESKPIERKRIGEIIENACENVGLDKSKYGSHSLRKTWGYTYYKTTGDILLVQKVLGHNSINDTLRYIGIQKDDILGSYQVLDNAYGKLV